MPSAPPTVIFDIDGTLVDTNYLHALAWRRAFLDFDIDVPTARIHRMVGAAGDVLLEELVGDVREDIKNAWSEHFDALKPEIRPLPGAQRLLRVTAERGATVVLASSSQPDDLEALLTALASDDVIAAVVSAGDVETAKPEPDVFEAAMTKVGASWESSIVVGDAPWDVKAATRAGLATVCVLTGGFARAELDAAGAVAVYEDAAQLADEITASPLAPHLGR